MSQSYIPAGVLVRAESISGDGEIQGYAELVVTMEHDGEGESIIDIRLDDRKKTIWMLKLSEVEGALKILKRGA
jgi:hypothetical protein